MHRTNDHRRDFLKSSALLGSAALFGGLNSTTDAGETVGETDANIWDLLPKRRAV